MKVESIIDVNRPAVNMLRLITCTKKMGTKVSVMLSHIIIRNAITINRIIRMFANPLKTGLATDFSFKSLRRDIIKAARMPVGIIRIIRKGLQLQATAK